MRDIPSYDPASLEAKWQARWAERHTNEPGQTDPPEHRHLPPPAPQVWRHVRLASRAIDHRSRVLQVDPVALSPALQGGPRVQEARGGELVSQGQDGARQRAGDRRPL